MDYWKLKNLMLQNSLAHLIHQDADCLGINIFIQFDRSVQWVIFKCQEDLTLYKLLGEYNDTPCIGWLVNPLVF